MHAQRREDSLQGGVSRHGHHAEHHQRFEVPAAQAHEIARATTRGKRHPDAEEETTHGMGQPEEPRPCIDRLLKVDASRGLQPLSAEHRDRHGEHVHPKAAQVTERDGIGERPHGAEGRALGNGAEHEGQREAEQRDDFSKVHETGIGGGWK
jgi:hypothetical protein